MLVSRATVRVTDYRVRLSTRPCVTYRVTPLGLNMDRPVRQFTSLGTKTRKPRRCKGKGMVSTAIRRVLDRKLTFNLVRVDRVPLNVDPLLLEIPSCNGTSSGRV